VIVELVGECMLFFPIGCCSHAMLDYAWCTSQSNLGLNLCMSSLLVREVTVVGRSRLSGL
jgi:hypothetical protein